MLDISAGGFSSPDLVRECHRLIHQSSVVDRILFYQKPLAFYSLNKTYIQGVSHIVSPAYTGDSMWFDFFFFHLPLQKLPFKTIRDITLCTLAQKVVFPVAVFSARHVSELALLSCK